MIHAALRVESTALIETNIVERVGVNAPFNCREMPTLAHDTF
jgi:hypothetical protein